MDHKIELKWDQSLLDKYGAFGGDFERRLAFSSVRAINNMAKLIQLAEQARVSTVFEVRQAQRPFWFGVGGRVGGAAARITTFASIPKGKQFAEIEAGTLPSGGDRLPGARHLLLRLFEYAGRRVPMRGKNVAIPVWEIARGGSKKNPIGSAFLFKSLAMRAYYKPGGKGKLRKLKYQGKYAAQLKKQIAAGQAGTGVVGEYGTKATGFTQVMQGSKGIRWRGKYRTFIAFGSKKHPLGAVYQRIGPGPLGIRVIWAFHRPFPLDSRLQFIATADRIAARNFKTICENELQKELAIDFKAAYRAGF